MSTLSSRFETGSLRFAASGASEARSAKIRETTPSASSAARAISWANSVATTTTLNIGDFWLAGFSEPASATAGTQTSRSTESAVSCNVRSTESRPFSTGLTTLSCASTANSLASADWTRRWLSSIGAVGGGALTQMPVVATETERAAWLWTNLAFSLWVCFFTKRAGFENSRPIPTAPFPTRRNPLTEAEGRPRKPNYEVT